MSGKFQPWIDSRRYLNLSEVLPLSTPLSILIDPSNICNFQCIFCPTGHSRSLASVGRPKGTMEPALFRKIINDMRAFPKKLRGCYLFKDGEPLINNNLGSMIADAKRADITESLEITSNGSLLTLERSIELIEAGLDRIRISVEHVENNGYLETTRTFGSYDTIRKNVESLFLEKEKRNRKLHVHAKLLDMGLSEEKKQNFLADFQDITDTLYIDSIMMNWPGSGSVDFSLGKSVKTAGTDRLVCPEPFKTLSVNFNGIVSVCCMDWKMETAVGDCRCHSLQEIWAGDALKEFRLKHLRGERRQIPICADCQYIERFNEMNDLDSCRDRLIEPYNEIPRATALRKSFSIAEHLKNLPSHHSQI